MNKLKKKKEQQQRTTKKTTPFTFYYSTHTYKYNKKVCNCVYECDEFEKRTKNQ